MLIYTCVWQMPQSVLASLVVLYVTRCNSVGASFKASQYIYTTRTIRVSHGQVVINTIHVSVANGHQWKISKQRKCEMSAGRRAPPGNGIVKMMTDIL